MMNGMRSRLMIGVVLRSIFVPLRMSTDARKLTFITDLDKDIDIVSAFFFFHRQTTMLNHNNASSSPAARPSNRKANPKATSRATCSRTPTSPA